MEPVELGNIQFELGGLLAGVAAFTLMVRFIIYCFNDTTQKTVSNEEILKNLLLIKEELLEIKQTLMQLQHPNTFVFETETDSESEQVEEQSQKEEEQVVLPEPVQPQQQTEANEPNQKDAKHAQLRQKMKDGNELYVSYKKTTFVGSYTVKADAPNGYVIKHNGVDYLTPSQFSFKMKRSINPTISSDNGWDSIHILSGLDEKGKQIKMSLKHYINEA